MATHRWKGQLAKFRGGGVEVNETGRRVGICWGWTSLHPIGPGIGNSGVSTVSTGFRGSARFRRHPPWIILCLGPRDAFSGLFPEAGAFPLQGGLFQASPGSGPVRRGVFKDLQSPCLKMRWAPSREPFIQPLRLPSLARFLGTRGNSR